ncbi:pentapeptide repeat-containing protein [Nostoc sp. UIC 10607]|uniref:pentapeptide repeat-containing protein n=1 Tax=Nostoc sp. UIC 10607 TaxID=3045935 RepID=UPI0039A3013C
MNQDKLKQKLRIEHLADKWVHQKKSNNYLLKGRQLKEAKRFQEYENANLMLSPFACEFIQQSITYRRNNRFRLIGFGFFLICTLTIYLELVAQKEKTIKELWIRINATKRQKESSLLVSALQEMVNLGGRLHNVQLASANLTGADLASADLRYANLRYANLIGTNLTSANLTGVDLTSANLTNANLTGVDLTSANLTNANLIGVDLTSANLTNANLTGVDLTNANLTNSDLTSTNLANANLTSTILISTILVSTKLTSANLTSANLRNSQNLTLQELKTTRNWDKACYDRGFRKRLGLPLENPNQC